VLATPDSPPLLACHGADVKDLDILIKHFKKMGKELADHLVALAEYREFGYLAAQETPGFWPFQTPNCDRCS
jgi:hypothetical protein